jgi:hypothetical protein
MKRQMLAILFVFIMVASAFGAVNLSATKVSAAGETLTLASTNYSPTAGVQYTLSGTLKDAKRNPLANKPIDIYFHVEGGAWHFSNTIYTGTDGTYTTTTSSSETVYLQTGYYVNGAYPASSNVIKINVQRPTLTLAASSTDVYAFQTYTLSGYLRDSAGNGVANQPINILYHFAGETAYHHSNTVYTDATGYYSTTTSSTQSVYLLTQFMIGRYAVSTSNRVQINVMPITTSLTLSASNTNPHAGQQYKISGYLRTYGSGQALSNKAINIDYYYPSVGGDWKYSNTIYTDPNGFYTTTVSSTKDVYLQTVFPGGQGYRGTGSNAVFIQVD